MAGDLETEFIANPTDNNREAWLSAQEAQYRTTASAVERKRFLSRLAFYEEGEHTGRLLAKIANSQQVSPSIGALLTHTA